ncbi:MAG: RluA family pseudouridine synthase [Alphaproteobacteria bacterium]|nr:RluA family pseudouridine synthase [Alphaproteobacteria bacterium]
MNSRVKQRHARGLYGPEDSHELQASPAKAEKPALTLPQAGLRSLEVEESEAGQRLDKFIATRASAAGEALSRTRVQALIAAGEVRIDGTKAEDAGVKLRAGQSVVIAVPEATPAEPVAQSIPLKIVFEDEHLIIIDKPAGLVVHPAAGHENGTLVNALLAHCGDTLSGIGGVKRPGIMHRLDKDTSGLLAVAKNDLAHQGLAALFADHGETMNLQREYRALVWGVPHLPFGAVDAPLGRHPVHREKQAIVHGEKGRHAVTHWRRLEVFSNEEGKPAASLIACVLETGRTHQIRVHMAHLGHPVMGDPLYATGFKTKIRQLPQKAQKALERLGRQGLHAAVLGFDHPVSGEPLQFESQLPADMQALLKALGAKA